MNDKAKKPARIDLKTLPTRTIENMIRDLEKELERRARAGQL